MFGLGLGIGLAIGAQSGGNAMTVLRSYTPALADVGKTLRFNSPALAVLTVPGDDFVDFPIGSAIGFVQVGAGRVVAQPHTTQVVINNSTGLLTSSVGSVGRLVKTAPNTWEASGNLSAMSFGANIASNDRAFDAWLAGSTTVTPNAWVAPDGTCTADEITETATHARHDVRQPMTLVSGTTYTLSVFARSLKRRFISLSLNRVADTSNYFCARFNVETGHVTSTSSAGTATLTSARITNIADTGWFRLEVTGVLQATDGLAIISTADDPTTWTAAARGAQNFLGSTGVSVALWNCRVEAASAATPEFIGVEQPYFAASGCSWPWVSAAVDPHAIYSSAADKTFVVWEGWDAALRRRTASVRAFAHATGTWGTETVIGLNPLTNDDHGNPAIVRDHQGYLHCFYGTHQTAGKYGRTVRPDDETEWVDIAFADIVGTYHHPRCVDGNLYVFYRDTGYGLRVLVSATLDGGVATWSASTKLVDFTSDSRFYQACNIVVGTDIYVFAIRADRPDTYRKDLFCFIYSTTDGSVRNLDGSVVVSAAALPVSRGVADASFRFYEHAVDRVGAIYGVARGADGRFHIVFADGEYPDVDLYYSYYNGAWSTPEPLGITADRYEAACVFLLDDGRIDVLIGTDTEARYVRGGDIVKMTRSVSGVWGKSLIQRANGKALGNPCAVEGGAGYVFCENEYRELDPSIDPPANSYDGVLRMYMSADLT